MELFSKVMSIIAAILVTTVFIILLPFALNEIYGSWIKVQGTIINTPTCNKIDETLLFKCAPIEISYKLPSDATLHTVSSSEGIVSKNQKQNKDIIDVWYRKGDKPTNVSFINQNPLKSGNITLAIMTVLLIFSWLWVFITHKT